MSMFFFYTEIAHRHGRRKLARQAFAYEVCRGISDEQFEGLAGGSAMEAATLGRMSAKEVLAAPLERTNGERVDEKKWVEYTGMDRTALIKKGGQHDEGRLGHGWMQACKVAGQ